MYSRTGIKREHCAIDSIDATEHPNKRSKHSGNTAGFTFLFPGTDPISPSMARRGISSRQQIIENVRQRKNGRQSARVRSAVDEDIEQTNAFLTQKMMASKQFSTTSAPQATVPAGVNKRKIAEMAADSNAERPSKRVRQEVVVVKQPLPKKRTASPKKKLASGKSAKCAQKSHLNQELASIAFAALQQAGWPDVESTEGTDAQLTLTVCNKDDVAQPSKKASVPKATLQYIGKWLETRGARYGNSNISNLLLKVDDGRLTSTSSKHIVLPLQLSPADEAPNHPFFDLPNELLNEITSYLDPADMVSLTHTCRDAWDKVDCQLIDLHNGNQLSSVLLGLGGELPLIEQLYDAVDRLDKDLLNLLWDQEIEAFEKFIDANPDSRQWPDLTCSVCLKRHQVKLFSDKQQDVEPNKRVCLAAEKKILLCDHHSVYVDFKTVREMRRAGLKHSSFRSREDLSKYCTHEDHNCRILNPYGEPPELSALTRGTERVYNISRVRYNMAHIQSVESQIADALQHLENEDIVRVCNHVELTDEVKRSFTKEQFDRKNCWSESYVHECATCGVQWAFQETDVTKSGGKKAMSTIQLVVQQTPDQTADPWHKDWLKRVEGGLVLAEELGLWWDIFRPEVVERVNDKKQKRIRQQKIEQKKIEQQKIEQQKIEQKKIEQQQTNSGDDDVLMGNKEDWIQAIKNNPTVTFAELPAVHRDLLAQLW